MKHRSSAFFRPAAFLGVFSTLTLTLAAQSFTWNGAVSQDWFQDANWTRTGSASGRVERNINANGPVVLRGSVSNDFSLTLSQNLTIDGAAGSAGFHGQLDHHGSTLAIVNGGFADVREWLSSHGGEILISGISADGRRSTLRGTRVANQVQREPFSNFTVEDGGLLEAEVMHVHSNQVTVRGVHANGTQSTLDTASITFTASGNGELRIENGGLVTAGKLWPTGNNRIIVDGTSAGGHRSSLLVETGIYSSFDATAHVTGGGRIEAQLVSDGTFDVSGINSTLKAETIRGSILKVGAGGLVQTDRLDLAGFSTSTVSGSAADGRGVLEFQSLAGQAHSQIVVDGGIVRLTGEGKIEAKVGWTVLEAGAGGLWLDTPGDVVLQRNGIGGSGGLTKIGSGSVEFAVGNTYRGGTIVSEGALFANNRSGSATGSGDVRVLAGALLGGSGSLAGNLTNAGTVAPGNSTGTLQVGGNFTQQPTGTLEMEIVSASRHDVLNVEGDVRLGGDLRILNSVPLEIGDRFELIAAGGEISGKLDAIHLAAEGSVRPNFVTSGGSGMLSIAPTSYTQVAVTGNERRLAEVLDPWIGSGDADRAAVVAALDSLSVGSYRGAFAAMSPAIYQAGLDTTLEQSQNQLAVLGQRLAARHLQRDPQPDAKRWETWAISSGMYSRDSLSSVRGDDFSSGAFLTGLEMQVHPALSLGILAGSSESRGRFPGRSRIEIERAVLGAYAAYSDGGFHASSSIGGGKIDLDVDRGMRFGGLSRKARSDTDGSEFFTHFGGGYDFHRGNWAFGPQAGLQYSRVDIDTVTEYGAGALNLRVRGVEMDSLRSRLGGRVAYFQPLGGGLTLIPESHLFWQHEYLRGGQSLDATLRGGGSTFRHHSGRADADSVVGGLGVGLQTPFGLYGNVAYDLELGREGEPIHSISLGADWKF